MTFKVSDLFKDKGEFRAKVDYQHDFSNSNVYAKNFVKTNYANTIASNDFTTLLDDEEILSIRLIDKDTKEQHSFDRVYNNRVQYFYLKDRKIDYKEIVGVEKISGEGYLRLKEMGYNNFYNLYKVNPLTKREEVLCVLCFKK